MTIVKQRDKEQRKFDKAVKTAAVSLVKSAAKEVWNENAENQKSLQAIASILKEQESTDGGSKIAAANKGTVTFSGYATDQREAALCSILGKLDTKDFKSLSSDKKSRS